MYFYDYASQDPINNYDLDGTCNSNSWYGFTCPAANAATATGTFIAQHATLSNASFALGIVSFAGYATCAVTEGVGCGIGVLASWASAATSTANAVETCTGGGGSCTGAALDAGLSLASAGIAGKIASKTQPFMFSSKLQSQYVAKVNLKAAALSVSTRSTYPARANNGS